MACYIDENSAPHGGAFERWNEDYDIDNAAMVLPNHGSEPGLTLLKQTYENGIFTCQFQRERLTTVLIPTLVNATYDLKENAYHLLLAYGQAEQTVTPDNKDDVRLYQHDGRAASVNAIKLDDYGKIRDSIQYTSESS